MTRTVALALVATMTLAAPGCGGGNPKADKDRAIATAIEAIQTRDAKRYASVMVSFEDYQTYCPPKVSANSGRTAADFAPGAFDSEAKILRKLRHCADVDWEGAKEISRRGGELRRVLSDKCGTALAKYRDIRVLYALENGDRVEVRLDDPVGVEGEYFAFSDEPRCRVRTKEAK